VKPEADEPAGIEPLVRRKSSHTNVTYTTESLRHKLSSFPESLRLVQENPRGGVLPPVTRTRKKKECLGNFRS